MASNVFVGVPDHEPAISLTVSPNPTTSIVQIASDKPLTSITVTDVQGRTLMAIPVHGDLTAQIDLTRYLAGVSFVTAATSDGAITMKTMKR